MQLPFNLSANQWPQILAGLVIVAGCAIMFMHEVLADIPFARSGVAVLTGLALAYLYFARKGN
ncbi:Uncharacterised protein [uncultured archaeon]|nr:Uncharacterised protein [uncultured archaeon]